MGANQITDDDIDAQVQRELMESRIPKNMKWNAADLSPQTLDFYRSRAAANPEIARMVETYDETHPTPSAAAPAPAAAASDAAAPATNDSDNGDNIYARHAKAQAEMQGKKDNTSKLDSLINGATHLYNGLPNGGKLLADAAAGIVGGKILRNLNPNQENVYGTHEYLKAQDAHENLVNEHEPNVYKAHAAAEDALRDANQSHSDKANILANANQIAAETHQNNLDALQSAHMEHENAKTLRVEEELARRGIHPPQAIPEPDKSIGITPQPHGGSATTKYGLGFGLTPEEARLAPSMSAVQQENIPANKNSWDKINKVAPGFEQIAESPLLVGPEGQQAVNERLSNQATQARAQQSALEKQQAQYDAHKSVTQDELNRRQAAAKLALETAQENARLSAKAAKAAENAHVSHVNTPAATESQQRKPQELSDQLEDIRQRIQKQKPGMLAKIGTKVAAKYIPGVGAAFAPLEAEAAKQDYQNGNYLRAGVHGLGTVGALAQATGFPPAMGLGDILQTPSALMGAYDIFNEEPKK